MRSTTQPRMLFVAAAIAVTAFLFAGTPRALAQHEHHADHATSTEHSVSEQTPAGEPYPLSVDPLGDSLVDVAKPIVVKHDGRILHFATQTNADKFNEHPDTYLAKVDAMIVEQQKPYFPMDSCVVTGPKLDAMGKPVDFVYGNRLVRLCCQPCRMTFDKSPGEYLKKIDAAVVEKQKDTYPLTTCVVSGGKLGAMGEPVNYTIGNRLVKFCCPACISTFEANPAKYLAKINAATEHETHQPDDTPHHH